MNNYTLYKHVTPSGKVYVGITNLKPEYRWNNGKGYLNTKDGPFKRSILKYGWDSIKHIILIELLSAELAKQWEIRLITHYKKLGISLNITDGGDGTYGTTAWNKGTKGVVKGYWKGKQMSDLHKRNLSYAHIGKKLPRKEHIIYVYNHLGLFVNVYKDITSCCTALNVKAANIRKVLCGMRNHIGGFQLRDESSLNVPLKYLDSHNYKETFPIVAINKVTLLKIYMESVFDLPRMLNREPKRVLDTIKRQGSYFGWYYERV